MSFGRFFSEFLEFLLQNPSSFKKVVTLALAVETPSLEGCSLEVSNSNYLNEFAKKKLKTYVKGSVKAAYKRVSNIDSFHFLYCLFLSTNTVQ